MMILCLGALLEAEIYKYGGTVKIEFVHIIDSDGVLRKPVPK